MELHIINDTILLENQGEVDKNINWSEIYPDSVEEIPPDMPDTKVNPVRITTFVDEYHSRYLETRQSVTGVIMFLKITNTVAHKASE